MIQDIRLKAKGIKESKEETGVKIITDFIKLNIENLKKKGKMGSTAGVDENSMLSPSKKV